MFSDGIIVVRVPGKTRKINIIRVYAPTADKYENRNFLQSFTKSHETNIIIGNFNDKIRNGEVSSIV